MVTQIDPETFFAALDSELEQQPQSTPSAPAPALPSPTTGSKQNLIVVRQWNDNVVMLILGGMLIIGMVSIVMTLSKRD